jgi:hypothetical protein
LDIVHTLFIIGIVIIGVGIAIVLLTVINNPKSFSSFSKCMLPMRDH